MINRHIRKRGINKLDDSKYTNQTSFSGFDTVENDFGDTYFKMSQEKSELEKINKKDSQESK